MMEIEKTIEEAYFHYITANPKTFGLLEAGNLTVKKVNKPTYSTRPHIGGEEFKIQYAYYSKKDVLIFVFAPVEAADYSYMEMKEASARKQLAGFDAYLKEMRESDILEQVADLIAEKSGASERAKIGTRKEYEDMGYGTW